MRIDHIELQNFRCFENLKLDLHPRFNVLIGENGAGKTAILEALAVAAGSWLLGIGGYETRNIWPQDVRLIGEKIGSETTFEPQYPVGIWARGQVNEAPLAWMRSLESARGRTTQAGAADIKGKAAQAEKRVRTFAPVPLPVLAYYGAGRLWRQPRDTENRRALTQQELSRLEGYRDAIDSRVSAREFHRWLEYQARAAFQEGRSSPVFRAVLGAIRGAVEDAVEVRFDAKRLEVVVEFESGQAHPFAQLSDGQRNMLALTGDIAMRMARLNPQFDLDVLQETPGLVLIDELDLHLHPRWQRHVAADLRRTFPKVQFITTTHSPQIIGEMKPEEIIALDHRQAGKEPFQVYGMDSNFILRHAMGTTDRDESVRKRLAEIETRIEMEEYEEAQLKIDELRTEIGEFADLVRLQTRINKILILSR